MYKVSANERRRYACNVFFNCSVIDRKRAQVRQVRDCVRRCYITLHLWRHFLCLYLYVENKVLPLYMVSCTGKTVCLYWNRTLVFVWFLQTFSVLGVVSIEICRLTSAGIAMLKMRRSRDRLILDMGIPYLGKTVFILRRALASVSLIRLWIFPFSFCKFRHQVFYTASSNSQSTRSAIFSSDLKLVLFQSGLKNIQTTH